MGRPWTRILILGLCIGLGSGLLPGCSGDSHSAIGAASDGGAGGDADTTEAGGFAGSPNGATAGAETSAGDSGVGGIGETSGGGGAPDIPTQGGAGAGGSAAGDMGGQAGAGAADTVSLALSSRSLDEDWVSEATDGLEGDGEADLAWTASFSGEATALYILMTDSQGTPIKTAVDDNFQQWDTDSSAAVTTFLGTDPRGVDTWILGVLPKGALSLVNAADGSVQLGAGLHDLTLWAPPPLFNQLAGQYMKLVIARPGGQLTVSNLIKMPK